MIIELIFLAIFIFSFGGALFIMVRKIPVLNTLPKNGNAGIRDHHYILRIENKIKDFLIAFEKQIYLHKLLSFIKIITLRLEVKIDKLLHGIRKKAQQIDQELKEKQ
jgi:hypothetical protein